MGRPLKIVSFAKVLCKAARPLVRPLLSLGLQGGGGGGAEVIYSAPVPPKFIASRHFQ